MLNFGKAGKGCQRREERKEYRVQRTEKAESFDILCSNRSRVVQLQVAPRGLRTAKGVKDER